MMRRIPFRLLLTSVLMFSGLWCYGEPAVSALASLSEVYVQKQLSPHERRTTHLVAIPRLIARAYPVLVNIEPHPAHGRKLAEEGNAEIFFEIGKKDSLEDSLNKLLEINDLLTCEIIHDQICILPVRMHSDEILSNLDVRVSLDIENVSVWEALKIIVSELNKQQGTPYPLGLYPDGLTRSEQPVSELTELKEITLHLHDVTAREAICAVFSASSIKLSYRYVTSHELDTLTILSAANAVEESDRDKLTPEQMEWWRKERGMVDGKWIPLGTDKPFQSKRVPSQLESE